MLPRFLQLSTYRRRNDRNDKRPPLGRWSLGILGGATLEALQPLPGIVNPILTAADITDRPAAFIADPFMLKHKGEWFLFFETFDTSTEKGVIGLATSSDLTKWEYRGTVLENDGHLSYPYVFEHEGHFFMIPESKDLGAVVLFRATDFPLKWEVHTTLIRGRYADPSIFYFQDRWWLFACKGPYCTVLFHSPTLFGEWKRHRRRYLHFRNKSCGRPGGRVVIVDGMPIRFAQDNLLRYGHQSRAFRATQLSETTYVEEELARSPFLTPTGSGWNGRGMHHIDAHCIDKGSWVAVVDGDYEEEKALV